ncbi:hypothetical protein WJX73_002659 [Symbiochloris irregularis]|uniref:Uncharacterized protein n=1 Tax=Symbiochloris irregularis TaxID=706552 RepID=A0AAW1PYZ6_9CHLO
MAAVDTLPISELPSSISRAHKDSLREEKRDNGDVNAEVVYTIQPPSNEELFFRVYQGEQAGGPPATNAETVTKDVRIRNLRNLPFLPSLDIEGFQLEKLVVPEVDWADDEQIKAVLYPLVESLIRKTTGASRVHLFDHTLRKGSMRNSDGHVRGGRGQPVPRLHVDYTLRTGHTRLKELLPDEADQLTKTPFAVIQVWRPLKGTVDDSPLAMVDARSVHPDDFLSNRLEFPERTGYTYAMKHNPAHQFYYAEGLGRITL